MMYIHWRWQQNEKLRKDLAERYLRYLLMKRTYWLQYHIPADADEYIAGLMIMNDMSARALQMEEMLLNLGPAKGKDFATVIGPMLVTLDELEEYEVPCKENHTGKAWNLQMKCSVNGIPVSEGNVSDMYW